MKYLLPLITFLLLPNTAFAQAFISEVHWAGTDLSTADEWLEITADVETDISGWYITSLTSKGNEKEIASFPDETALSPGQYFVISNYSAEESRLAEEPSFVTTSISLPNSKLLLRLYTASGVLIDEVDDGTGAPLAGGKQDGMFASMEKMSDGMWQTTTVSLGIDADVPVFGTPGFPPQENPEHSTSSSSSSESNISLPDIRITEVLANPEGRDDGKEWIELWNAGEETVYLEGMQLHIGSKNFEFTNSDLALIKNEYIHLLSSYTGISLSNKGNTIQLLSENNEVIDELEYAETAEGVSYGYVDNSLQPLCMPSPGKLNKKVDQLIIIDVQSGKTKGKGSTTLNLQARALNGSIDYVDCYWEYSDGFRSMSCNPPSHTFEDEGVFSVEMRATNICGDSIIEVLHGKVYPEEAEEAKELASSASSQSSASFSSLQSSSSKSYKLEVEISEVYPSPNSGEDEWIELHNPNNFPVDLTDWRLDDIADSGSKPWTINDENSAIKSGERILYYRAKTKLALNNTGDAVRILDPNGEEKASVQFPSIPKGQAYIPAGDCTTLVPSPAKANICRHKHTKVAGVSTIKKAPPKTSSQAAFDTYVIDKYKNIVHNSALEIEKLPAEQVGKSPVVASFLENTILGGNITAKQPKEEFIPYELLFYLLLVIPGWWFVMKKYYTRH